MTRRHRLGGRRAAGLCAALLAVAGLAACGVPTGPPSAIPAGQVPFNLISPNPPATTTSLPGGVPFNIYLFNPDGALQPFQRTVPVKVAGLTAILEYLVAGPSADEAVAGVSTFIPPDTRVLSVSPPVNGVITVNFSDALRRVTGSSQGEAVEQIVFTIDNAPQIPQTTGVQFEIDGFAIGVPKGNSPETLEPVTMADYPGATVGTTTTTTPTATTAPPG